MGSIVILTGAGISQESGIDTFRSEGGVWSKVKLEDVATPEGFDRNPKLVQEFYNDRRRQLVSGEVQPNAAHIALARLEKEWRGEFLLVTQNIDNLHSEAGSKRMIHMHGELMKARNLETHDVFDWGGDITENSKCPKSGKLNVLRPHVVWFGEMPLDMDLIYSSLSDCDIFISIGTSGNVYPASGFVEEASLAGARTIEINLEPSIGASSFEEKIYGKATEVLPKFVAELLLKQS